MTLEVIEAELTWTGERFEPGVRIAVGEDGLIAAVGALSGSPTLRVPGAILPGMVNVHSHAFQRGLRGRGQMFPGGAGSFWSWREAMYELVDSLDAHLIYRLSHQAFSEMLAAGITTVGEFHYVHHDQRGEGYALDEVVLRAAADAGIRIVLLNTYYRTGGVGTAAREEPLSGGQQRFRTASPEEYWGQMDALTGLLQTRTQSLGAVVHSIRAATIDEIAAMHEESRRRRMVFHIHVEEQPKEVRDCTTRYGRTPMALLCDRLKLDDRFTAVHCTHTTAEDLARYLAFGGRVCMIPLTEADLGDGIADVPSIIERGRLDRLCLGTDSNHRIAFNEEMRWLEYVQRLARQRRGVLVDDRGSNAAALWRIATENGAAALGVRAGRIAPGWTADFITLDLGAPSLAVWTPQTLLDAFIFGSGSEAIAARCIGGRWLPPSKAGSSPGTLRHDRAGA